MILGITGGIATGKTTVSRMFYERGAVVIDADQIARQVVEPGTEGLGGIVAEFGESILRHDGALDREILGNMIFQDPCKRKTLEVLLHPRIREKLIMDTKKVLLDQADMVVWDIPLLIEREMMSLVDHVILVYVPESVQFERLMDRNAFSREKASNRIQSQINIEEKRKYADFIIDNQWALTDTMRQVDQIWQTITQLDRKES